MARKSSKTAHVMNLLAGNEADTSKTEAAKENISARQTSDTTNTIKELTVLAQQASIQTQDGPLSPSPISIINMSSSVPDPVAERIKQQLEEEEKAEWGNMLSSEEEDLKEMDPEPVQVTDLPTAPIKTETTKIEISQTETMQNKTSQTKPMQTEASQEEPMQAESLQTETLQTETTQTETLRTEPSQTESLQTESLLTEPTQTETLQAEPTQSENLHTEPEQTSPSQANPEQATDSQAESLQTLPLQSDSPQIEPQPPLSLPDYQYLNIMEHVVNSKVEEYMQKFDVCTCGRCVADVKALALTHLPAKYIVVEPPAVSPLLNFYSNRYSQQIIVELTKACSIVKENPHH